MIERYTRKAMGQIWSADNKFNKMLDVEVAVARTQARHKIIPEKAAREIAKKSKFSVSRILEIEKTTKHDVIAFVSNLAENVGESGRFIHYGLTSSDVVDTALSLQIKDACELVAEDLKKLEKVLERLSIKYATTLCAGRTHGMHAEVTSFGVKLCGYLSELKRNQKRFALAAEQMRVGKLSGAVGTYTSLSQVLEKEVCQRLGLEPETLATQVIPRDRLAELLWALAMIGGFIERLSVELRHLQRTEVGEVTESFSKGQKGSSAMPHKKNPISAENLTGMSRLLRSYLLAGLENVPLWHERDISHSSVERVILPDAFIVCDYSLHRLTELLAGLEINKNRMQANLNLSQGQLFSSQVLLLLVRKGLSREEAYKIVQEVSHNLKPSEHLRDKLLKHPEVKKRIKKMELDQVFKEASYKIRFKNIIDRVVRS